MTQEETLRFAVSAAQGVLRQSGASIDVDGKWGSYTQKVYEAAPPTTRAWVDNMLKASGTTASSLRAARAEQKANGLVAMSQVTSVEDAIRAAADEAGLSYALMLGMAKIESNLNPSAVNGSSKGLMQMQPAAWTDAKKIRPSLPEYQEGVMNALQNARAGAAYILYNTRALSRAGYNETVSPAVLYLAHQQGAAGFTELWKVANGKPVSTNYVTAEKMTRNPPPDKRGATTDKKEFYQRWMTVAQRKTQ